MRRIVAIIIAVMLVMGASTVYAGQSKSSSGSGKGFFQSLADSIQGEKSAAKTTKSTSTKSSRKTSGCIK
ncbi:hypothetical protein ACFL5E_04130 [Candidatus Omnitrophota bacterium]